MLDINGRELKVGQRAKVYHVHSSHSWSGIITQIVEGDRYSNPRVFIDGRSLFINSDWPVMILDGLKPRTVGLVSFLHKHNLIKELNASTSSV